MSKIADAAYGDTPYAGSPGWKEPRTSRDAAIVVRQRSRALRDLVLQAITTAGAQGLTADEVAARLGRTVLAVRPRVTELAKAAPPRIVTTGERRANESGLKAHVWRVA
jgi:DNA-directed RNA polymerase specialized sigma24 family protein